MVDFIAEEFDVDVSVITISRILQKERISRKKVLLSPLHLYRPPADFSCKESQGNVPNYFVMNGLFDLWTGALSS